MTPADEAVARGGFPSGGAKAEQGQDAAFGTRSSAAEHPEGLVSQISGSGRCIHSTKWSPAQDRLQMQAGQLVHGSGQSGCGALQKVCLIGPEPPFVLQGAAAAATPADACAAWPPGCSSQRPPSGLNQKSWQAKREMLDPRAGRIFAISSHSRRISRPLSRPQKRFIQPPLRRPGPGQCAGTMGASRSVWRLSALPSAGLQMSP